MAVGPATRQRLEKLAAKEKEARAAVEAARAELVEALREAQRTGSSTRELAPIIGVSHQLIAHLIRERR